MVNRASGGKLDMHDFLPHEDQPEATIAEIAAALGAVPRG